MHCTHSLLDAAVFFRGVTVFALAGVILSIAALILAMVAVSEQKKIAAGTAKGIKAK